MKQKKDPFEVWNGKRFYFTLNKIAKISEGILEIPEDFKDFADEPIEVLSYLNLTKKQRETKGLKVRILSIFANKDMEIYKKEAKEGVIFITHYQMHDENNLPIPMIVLPDIEAVRTVWAKLGIYVKKCFEIPTIAVTGTVGKTTTILFLEHIFKQRYKVFVTGRNRNTSHIIIQKLIAEYGPEYDFHIQEVGGGGPLVVERSAKVLEADAFCITNVYPHHLKSYETLENVFYDKTSLNRFSKEEAFALINLDEENLRTFDFQRRTVTCGIEHKEADYVAENIRQDGIYLKFDIVHKNNRTPIVVNIPGVHNAYNGLFAFAMAKEWGLSDEEIQAGFLDYRSRNLRQNLIEVAGRTVYLDCFNSCVDSIKAALHTLDLLQPKEGGKRFAILGGENGIGNATYALHYELGLEMTNYNADEFIFVGAPENASEDLINLYGDVRAFYRGARQVVRDKPLFYFNQEDALSVADRLMRESHPGDVILFKGVFQLIQYAALDIAFGTSLCVYNAINGELKTQVVRNDKYSASYNPLIDGCNILKCTDVESSIKIPATIQDKPVHRIGRTVLSKRKNLENIDFGKSLKNIDGLCFAECDGLNEVNIPANVLYIEEEAFLNCRNLEKVELKGVLHIEKGAFRGCEKLQKIYISDSCRTIENDVFEGCPNVNIIGFKNSIAHQYAKTNNLNFIDIENGKNTEKKRSFFRKR